MKQTTQKILLSLFFCLNVFSLFANQEGALIVRNFRPTEYEGGSKIYSVITSSDGLLYAGDKNGILEFDGENWLKIKIGFAVNSLAVDSKNNVFVAGKEGIGELKRDSLNQIEYHSLNYLVTGYLNSNVFRKSQVFQLDKEILFVVDNKLVVFSEERIRIIENKDQYRLAQKVDNELYLYSYQSGLYKYSNGELDKVLTTDEIKMRHFWGIMNSAEGIVLWEDGANSYLLEGDKLKRVSGVLNDFVSEHVVDGIHQIDSNIYVLKTYYDGLLIVNSKREIIKQINQKGSLINNTVFGVDLDLYGNLWIGTSSGISVLRQDLPFTVYNTQSGIGSGYDSAKVGEDIYLGTSHGLWRKKKNDGFENDFEMIFPGHVFGLSVINGVLYLGHPSGIYSIAKNKIRPVIHKPGGSFIKKVPFETNTYLTNTNDGLLKLLQENGSLKKSNLLAGKNREIHNFEFDSLGNVWVEYDNGIYTFNWDQPEIKRFYTRVGKENRLKKVRQIDNELYFIADSGVYFFNDQEKDFYKPNLLKSINENNQIPTNILGNSTDKMWVFFGEKLTQYKLRGNVLKPSYDQPFKFIDGFYPIGFENVSQLSDSTFLIGSEEGFYFYEEKEYVAGTYSSVIIRDVSISSLERGKHKVWGKLAKQKDGFLLQLKEPISYSNNSIEFVFSAGAPNYNKVYYQTYLYGYNEKWSEWSRDNSREFTNLAAGDYRFVVRAINDSEEYSKIAVCEFKILPPWFLTRGMKILYVLLFFLISLSIIYWVRYTIQKTKLKLENRQKEEAASLEQQRAQEKLSSEKQLIRLRNEKLRSDNLHKAKELANLTFNLIQKNQVLTDFKSELEQIKRYSETNKLVTEDLRRLIRKVNKDIDKEENWEVFEDYFDTVHENFFIKLKKKFPDLTSKDLRLCAYLRMNLATKEIAPLLNITVRGVEIGRYRLRRKLELDRNVNFTTFLNSL
ncbi:triple tyrosine motif-containing protein [Labilibaculum sp.]|uniref:triple tyrosine motif-containing protein n=1 Tax=Labilibaculum sp. TaxID=2060723 RepID=UPI0035613953